MESFVLLDGVTAICVTIHFANAKNRAHHNPPSVTSVGEGAFSFSAKYKSLKFQT